MRLEEQERTTKRGNDGGWEARRATVGRRSSAEAERVAGMEPTTGGTTMGWREAAWRLVEDRGGRKLRRSSRGSMGKEGSKVSRDDTIG